jgi:oxygen-independent coproporphyrinogen-3 oxidase
MQPYYLYRQKNMIGNMENTGHAKSGKICLYNILMMEEIHTVLALGAGAVTKKVDPDGKITRTDNVKNVAQYIERIDEMKRRKSDLLCLKNQD